MEEYFGIGEREVVDSSEKFPPPKNHSEIMLIMSNEGLKSTT